MKEIKREEDLEWKRGGNKRRLREEDKYLRGGSVCAQAKKIPVPGWLGAPTEKPMALMEG